MTDKGKFPEYCIRGISIPEGITEEGRAGTSLFLFKDENAREDGWIEESINWKDNDEVIDFTLAQKRDADSFQFRYGVAVLPKREIDHLKRFQREAQSLSYERNILPDNPYHGNLLLSTDVPKKRMRQIAASLALFSSIIRRKTTE